MSKQIAFSCGCCGAPCSIDGEQIFPVPEGYNPDAYVHNYCNPCGNEYSAREGRRVTHEMAMDAGDPSLEGTEY